MSPRTLRSKPLMAPWFAGVALLFALAPLQGFAADGDPSPEPVDFAVPDAPAFTFLSTTPTQVAQPGTARDLAVQLVNAVGSDGKVQQGFALEVRPWYLVPGLSIPLSSYQKPGGFILANLQLSVGTAQTSGDDTRSTNIAVGLRATLFDDGDPMRNAKYAQELGARLLECAPDMPGSMSKEDSLACASRKADVQREAWRTAHWNATRLSVAVASGWRSPDSILKDSRWTGLSAWATGGFGLGTWGQVLGQLRYDHQGLAGSDALSFGTRFNVGSKNVNGFVEVSGANTFGLPEGSKSLSAHAGFGVEFRVTEKVWLSTGLGQGFTEAADPIAVTANLRWALADKESFDPSK